MTKKAATQKIEELLSAKEKMFDDFGIQRGYRDGIELEKGVTLTQEYIDKHFDQIVSVAEHFTAYPDMYLDLIKPSDSNFSLFFYQRIVLRALMRFKVTSLISPFFFRIFPTCLADAPSGIVTSTSVPGDDSIACSLKTEYP